MYFAWLIPLFLMFTYLFFLDYVFLDTVLNMVCSSFWSYSSLFTSLPNVLFLLCLSAQLEISTINLKNSDVSSLFCWWKCFFLRWFDFFWRVSITPPPRMEQCNQLIQRGNCGCIHLPLPIRFYNLCDTIETWPTSPFPLRLVITWPQWCWLPAFPSQTAAQYPFRTYSREDCEDTEIVLSCKSRSN